MFEVIPAHDDEPGQKLLHVLYAEKNQSGQYAWKEAGQIDLDSEDKIDWVTIECGEEFCRCSHYAWVHFPQLEGTDIGIQQFLGRAPSIPANSLPETRAHHAMAEADPTNSLVATTARFVYVIGGQKLSTDGPGGTDTVFMASVDPTAGTVGTWTALTSTLPQQLVGVSATVYNGYLYVAGGLTTGALPSNAVYSAPIKTDGTLGTWTTATNALPTATAFGTLFAFGGKLYFVNGDPTNSTTPNTQGLGTNNVYYASALRGAVGT